MSHLGARVVTVLWEDRPYLREAEGKDSREEARGLVLS